MPRCRSTCRKKTAADCTKSNRCSYTNGSTRKYCRLSAKYKMKPPECRVTRRYTKKNAATVIQRAFRNQRQRLSRLASELHKSEYLNAVCSDANVCIAFGKESNKIKRFFHHFRDFNYLTGPAKRMGKVSNNGFVKLLHYERAGYSANALLKSSAKIDADNLYYEYLVGRYINKQGIRFPCFVETYGAFRYLSPDVYVHMKDHVESGIDQLKTGLIPLHGFRLACKQPESCSILVQHINHAPTLAEKCHDAEFVRNDIVAFLFQVYMPLAQLKNEFTHYDLHLDNVLVYEPVKGSYIEYHYHMENDTVIRFKSAYIAKIIDYGRSFFVDAENPDVTGSSKRIYTELCSLRECEPACGYNYGFSWLSPHSKNPKHNYFISSQMRNWSHDLRLLDMLRRKSTNPSYKKAVAMVERENPALHKLAKSVKYQINYGTEEKPTTTTTSRRILNVEDAKNALQEMMVTTHFTAYLDKTKLGDMHVYSDGRPLQYISA